MNQQKGSPMVRRGKSSMQVIVKDMSALMFFIRKEPRTIDELAKLSGQHIDKVRRTLEALVDEGLVNRTERRSKVRPGFGPQFVFIWAESETV